VQYSRINAYLLGTHLHARERERDGGRRDGRERETLIHIAIQERRERGKRDLYQYIRYIYTREKEREVRETYTSMYISMQERKREKKRDGRESYTKIHKREKDSKGLLIYS